jgi:hypothetical protein
MQAHCKSSVLIVQFTVPAPNEASSGFTLEIPAFFRHL